MYFIPGEAAVSPSFSLLRTAEAISISPIRASICSTVTPPGLKSVGFSAAKVITVDSTPISQPPPSIISGTLPSISSKTYLAFVGLGLPERFALGAASGKPQALIIFLAYSDFGIRTATVSSPPEVTSGIKSLFFIIIVRGPGQNFSAISLTFSGISLTSGASSDISLI